MDVRVYQVAELSPEDLQAVGGGCSWWCDLVGILNELESLARGLSDGYAAAS